MSKNWRLTAKEHVSSPVHGRDLEKGFSMIVAAPSTGGPSHKDVVGALLLHGFCKEEAEKYDGSSWTHHFEGTEVGDLDSKLEDQQHKIWVDRNNYSHSESKPAANNNQKKKKKEKRDDDEEKSRDKDGCLTRILKAPFRLLWWIIWDVVLKTILKLLGIWFIISLFTGDDDD